MVYSRLAITRMVRMMPDMELLLSLSSSGGILGGWVLNSPGEVSSLNVCLTGRERASVVDCCRIRNPRKTLDQ